MERDEREMQDEAAEAAEDLDVGDEAENVKGGVLKISGSPDAGGHYA
jgi:hypothetical protein